MVEAMGDLPQRCLVPLKDILAQGFVVTGQVQALAALARTIESRAADDPSR